MESFHRGCIGGVWVWHAGIEADEVFHPKDAAHVARVIPEEDATKGSKRTYQVGLDSDWGFNTVGVGCARDNDCSSSRHFDFAAWCECEKGVKNGSFR